MVEPWAQGLQGNVTLSGSAIIITGHSVTLTWTAAKGATSYIVYRGTVHGGPYTAVSPEIPGTVFTDLEVNHDQTYYYVTTAVSGGSESAYSNEAVAVIP